MSASFKVMEETTLSLYVSPTYQIRGGECRIWGLLSPPFSNNTVILYLKKNSASWTVLGKVTTDSSGQFSYLWIPEADGVCYIRGSWSGKSDYLGSDSVIRSITVLPTFLVLFLGSLVIILCVCIAVTAFAKRGQPGNEELQIT